MARLQLTHRRTRAPSRRVGYPGSTNMARILVADDDHLLRWSLKQSLTQEGHLVRAVGSGLAAVEATEEDEFRVAIVQYESQEDGKPGGPQVLRKIKTHAPATHVIAISAESAPRIERQARDLGAFDFLEKPFHLVTLRQAVERAIATPERRRGPRGCCPGCEWQAPCTAL